jgi:hypothetical protein
MAKGKKTGGRQKGGLNKATRIKMAALERLKVDGKDPMSFFAAILRDTDAPYEERKYAAAELMPFYHPKLSSIEARTGSLTHEDRLQRLLAMMEDDRPRSADRDRGVLPNDIKPGPLSDTQQIEYKPGNGIGTPRGVDEPTSAGGEGAV